MLYPGRRHSISEGLEFNRLLIFAIFSLDSLCFNQNDINAASELGKGERRTIESTPALIWATNADDGALHELFCTL